MTNRIIRSRWDLVRVLVALGIFRLYLAWDLTVLGAEQPFLLGSLIAAFLLLAGATLLWFARARWIRAASVPAFVALGLCSFLPWHPRKQFVRDLYSVKAGMSVVEAAEHMAGYMQNASLPSAGRIGPDLVLGDRTDQSMSFRWSARAEFDADIGFVYFQSGRVVRVEFSPD